MTNAWSRYSQVFEQCLEARPRVTALLTAPIEPLQKNPLGVIKIITQTLEVASDTVVIPVSAQLAVQLREQQRFGQVAVLSTPGPEVG